MGESMAARNPGPLAGLRVVEMGRHLAAPLVGMLLADQGADVVRVTRPGAPEAPSDLVWQRGKRHVVLDLNQPDDARAARDILGRADVLVEGFRPEVLVRLGLDPDAIRGGDNPGLISCSLPGFSADDPRAWLPAWEGAIGALAGLYERSLRLDPVYTRLPLASLTAALYAANAIAAALYARDRDGRGQHAEVPLYDATFALQELTALFTVRPPSGWPTLRWAANPLIGTYRCKDGRWVQIHPVDGAAWLERVREMGHGDHATAIGHLIGAMPAEDPLANGSVTHAWRLGRALAALFRARDADEWEEALSGAGLPIARVRTGAEWLDEPDARAAGQVVSVDDPALGAIVQPGLAVRLERGPARPRPRSPGASAPADVLASWPARQPALPLTAADGGPPLHGVRVLDLGPPLAGPIAARTLAELGADVLRVELPGARGPWAAPLHIAGDAGKRSVALDPHAAPDAFWSVVEHFGPDVVIDAHDASGAAGGVTAFRARVPAAVWTRVSAYGAGPWAHRPGSELTVQAATGIQVEQGGDGHPRWLTAPLVEVGTGLLAAWGTLLALIDRRKSGRPQQVEACLSATATLAQSAWLFDHAGRAPAGPPDTRGSGALHRFYEARDGWMFFAAPEDVVPDLAAIDGLDALHDSRKERWEGILEEAFATAAVSVWQARIELAGLHTQVAVVHRHRPGQAMGDPRALTRDLVRFRDHAGVGRVTETGPPIRLSRTPLAHLRPAHALGSDTRLLLEDLDLPVPPDAPPVEADVPDARGGLAVDLAWWSEQARWGAYLVASRALRRLS